MKTCTKCKENKLLEMFSNMKRSRDGKNNECKVCCKLRAKNLYEVNKDLVKIKSKEYYLNNKSKKLEYNLKYSSDNKDKFKVYYVNNKSQRIEYDRVYKIKKYNTDDDYKLKISIRNSIFKSFKRSLKGKFNKSKKTLDILGCSFEEFKLYLELKFEDWMNWNNQGLYNGFQNFGWDIDHIVPISSAKTEEEIYKLNHYTNFQPLCSHINRDIKRNKY